ncbi:MAG: hypothetical protein K6E86_00230 [Bacteroidales bacterium]|nr:hypothetical protein [Bacteroidales bacterium]
MAIVKTSSLISNISGKVSSADGTYMRTNRITGKVYLVSRRTTKAAATPQAQLNRQRFAATSQAVRRWFAANRPGRDYDGQLGSIEYYLFHYEFRHQQEIGTFPAYVFRKLSRASQPAPGND